MTTHHPALIQEAFRLAESEGRAALMPYLTLGFPNLEALFAYLSQETSRSEGPVRSEVSWEEGR